MMQYFLFCLLIFFQTSWSAQAQDLAPLTINMPEKIGMGQAFNINVQFQTNLFPTYHRLIFLFPSGFNIQMKESAQAIFQKDGYNAKLLFTAPSSQNREVNSLQISPNSKLAGNYRIQIEIEYLLNKKKVKMEVGTLSIQVLEHEKQLSLTDKAYVFNLANIENTAQVGNETSIANDYCIQLLYADEAINTSWIAKQFELQEREVKENIVDGKYLYTTGKFKDEQSAKKWLKEHKTLSIQGIVIKFQNGKINAK